jgi:hypothetical protein
VLERHEGDHAAGGDRRVPIVVTDEALLEHDEQQGRQGGDLDPPQPAVGAAAGEEDAVKVRG